MIMLTLLGLGLTVGLVNLALDDDDSSQETTRWDDAENRDVVEGDSGDNSLFGREGEDLMRGGSGDDRIFGGEDDDVILGEEGDDLERGGHGDDLIIDGQGSDDLRGDAGDDIIIAGGFQNDAATFETFLNFPVNATPEQLNELMQVDYGQDTDTEGDSVSGGNGNDLLIVGTNDTVSSGEGYDDIMIGDWVEGSDPITITDFSRLEDVLVYSYDASDTEPEFALEETQDSFGDPDDLLLYANGQLVAEFPGGAGYFTLDNIVLAARPS